MALSKESQEFLKEKNPTYEEKAAASPKINIASSPVSSDDIERKRSELELKKLQIEIDRLEKPNTSMDYFQKMLELQAQHNKEFMVMQQENFKVQLELERLKNSGDDDGMSWIKDLLPLLPELIKQKKNQQPLNTREAVTKEGAVNSAPLQNQEEAPMQTPTTKAELDEYKDAVRRGEISFEEAYEDFLATPYGKLLSKDAFQKKFDAVKAGLE